MPENKTQPVLKVLLLYWSATGNTEKAAQAIRTVLEQEEVRTVVKRVQEAGAEELYEYDLIFMGSPSYEFLPPEPVQRFVKQKLRIHRERGDIQPGAPRRAGKKAVVFCTYSGPHTGINEATTTGEYLGQFFEHLGYEVAAKWYIVGEFHGREDLSTQGKLGDIRGRPNRQDLLEVEKNTRHLIKTLVIKA
jgi:flavorubredoxin